MATEKTDVVIIGVGAAGGIIAAELAKAGMKVIGLERGPRLKTEDFNPHDELRYFQRQDLRPNIKVEPVTWRPNTNARANPMPVLNNGNQAGGGTVHYGAVSWRLHEDDFRARSHTLERYGASAIPEDSSLADWPLSYSELEPYYDRAEYELGVSGKAGNLQGKKIDGGNVFEAPRQREYPLPPLLVEKAGEVFDAGTRKLGYHPFSTPRAILSQPYKDRPGCTYCGFCQAFGCHVGAKSSILVTKLPEADETGNFKLITGAMCYRVNSDNSGRATGVSYYGPDGSDNSIEANIVIVSTFIYDNSRLLMLSKTDKFPNGLANSSGQLGKHIMGHMMANVFVGFDDTHMNIYMGPSAQKHTIDDFNGDNFDHGGAGFIRGSQISIGTGNLQGGPIALTTVATPPGVPRWGAPYRDFLAKYFTRHAVMVAQTENLPYPDQAIDLDPNVRDRWGLPAPRVGSDPKNSVVNKYGQTWDIPNLFVIGSSSFPTMSGFNPTLTIQALAYMSADAIGNRYRKAPGALL
jgi:gluconate 2-dehydrogenase alpha chain